MAGKPTIQEMFVHHFDEVRRSGKLSAPQQRAGQAIVACRTEAMGGHEQRCPDGHFVRTQYHSCRHRSCPTCAEQAKGEWLDRQQERLLPCEHFHVIFTVPHELLALWRYNRREFTDALFGACRDTLLQLLGQERHLGATPGIVMALHTWGRTLNQHPHIHCLVTAGGLTGRGEWRDVAGDYLALWRLRQDRSGTGAVGAARQRLHAAVRGDGGHAVCADAGAGGGPPPGGGRRCAVARTPSLRRRRPGAGGLQ